MVKVIFLSLDQIAHTDTSKAVNALADLIAKQSQDSIFSIPLECSDYHL